MHSPQDSLIVGSRLRVPALVLAIVLAFLGFGSAPSAAQFSIFEDGFESGTCFAWDQIVPFCITPNVGLTVRITWDTPGDPNQSDAVGADLDLHLLNPSAGGDWEGFFDCYSGNPTPDWGMPGEHHDANLIFEDADGAGPEAVQLTDLLGGDFPVGVFYVDDAGFGPSFVTLEVFEDGVVVYQFLDKMLLAGEFWELGSVAWPGAVVTELDIIHDGIP